MRYGEDRTVKLYYSISEVVELTGVPAHILRYWEQEIPLLKPRKNRAGNRVFRDKEIQLVQRIKQLVQEEKFTLQGALKKLLQEEIPEVDSEALIEKESTNVPTAKAITALLESTEGAANPPSALEVNTSNAVELEPQGRPPEERKTAILKELHLIREMLKP